MNELQNNTSEEVVGSGTPQQMKNLMKNLDKSELEAMFEDDLKCLEFLSKVKWGSGYTCKRCGHDNYCKGRKPFSRRCTRCKHDESATAHTVFHNIKFPLSKALYIAYQICEQRMKISSYEFARRLSLRQMTCWKFKDKILQVIKGNKDFSDEDRMELGAILLEEKPKG